MERILRLSDDELREELSSKGYHPPPIQDDVTRRILRKKLAILIDPSLVIDEPVQNSDSSHDSDTTSIRESQSVRSRNRVRFFEPQEKLNTDTGECTRSVLRYALIVAIAILMGYFGMKSMNVI
uniref:Lamino-associated polypeptide 2/emerin,domain-containing protein n=1 Tax=Schistosoma japonicum TaxID=6182 RepID=C1L5G9_SCHJA|nr:Lamino-associated polypeptide 2/emerin,domain-containing protein [Schistosoma japonicum]